METFSKDIVEFEVNSLNLFKFSETQNICNSYKIKKKILIFMHSFIST